MLLGGLSQCCVERVGVEVQPSVPVSRAVLVGLVVACQEAPSVREAHIQERQELLEPRSLRGGEVARAGDGHAPVLFASLRLVAVKIAGGAEVVRALMAPDHGVGKATLATLHLYKTSEVPQELVRLAIVQELAEFSDHGMDRLQAVGGEVKVPSRVVADDNLPFYCHRVAQRKQTIPVARRIIPNAELSGHVLDHLWGDESHLHVVRVASASEKDSHGA
mmetsp:Transcript_65078/g.141275  ORF Transcript_65078/g.141275 Transcript_65078/m.141275 type:complete len:220 (+) Transcript_65078:1897-2556(+)